MEIIHGIQRMQAVAARWRQEGSVVAFVPTMGYLHDGHLSLVRRAKQMAEIVVVSIFVNPTQFGPSEDFDSYPRDTVRDCDLLKDMQVDYVFMPEASEMYGKDFLTRVHISSISEILCGSSRPDHFSGVATVIAKFINIIQPTFMIFGQKDFQQVVIMKRMVRDLNFPVELVVCPIVRESDGLATSSRNIYLNEEQRKAALVLYRAIREGESLVIAGEREVKKIRESMMSVLKEEKQVTLDYLEIVDTDRLSKLESVNDKALIVVAVFVGKTRLIDNVVVDPGEEL